jgi:hypothetical protein
MAKSSKAHIFITLSQKELSDWETALQENIRTMTIEVFPSLFVDIFIKYFPFFL